MFLMTKMHCLLLKLMLNLNLLLSNRIKGQLLLVLYFFKLSNDTCDMLADKVIVLEG